MLDQEIDVNSYIIHSLDVDFFQFIKEQGLVDTFLKRMQVDVESLIFTLDWAPQVQNLVHRILFPSSKTDCFLQVEGLVFE